MYTFLPEARYKHLFMALTEGCLCAPLFCKGATRRLSAKIYAPKDRAPKVCRYPQAERKWAVCFQSGVSPFP